MKRSLEGLVVCIVGLGYVRLPLAEDFTKNLLTAVFSSMLEECLT